MTGGEQRVLVTGAAGFIGTALTHALTAHGGFEVVAATRSRRPPSGVPAMTVDLTDPVAVTAMLGAVKPDAVVHVAGRVHGGPADLFRENAAATAVLADAILSVVPEATLTALGSAAEYGRPKAGELLHEDAPLRPITVYGHAKVAAALYLDTAADRGLRYNIVRLFNPVGINNSPNQVIGAFIAKLLAVRNVPEPRSIRMGSLDAIRDFIALDDCAALICRLLVGRQHGVVVNACSGKGTRVRDLIHRIRDKSGIDVEIEEAEAPQLSGGADIVVGDARRFMEISGLVRASSIEETLDAAWAAAARDANNFDDHQ